MKFALCSQKAGHILDLGGGIFSRRYKEWKAEI